MREERAAPVWTVEELNRPAGRSQARRFVASLVIVAATAQLLGQTVRMPSKLGANDISRWCTVWSLLERGTYAIDECPWHEKETQDKVFKSNKLAPPEPGDSPLTHLEYLLAPRAWKEGEPTYSFYSSKPPLLATIAAGILYPFRKATGVELHSVRTEPRYPRNVPSRVVVWPGVRVVLPKTVVPAEPHKWPAYVYYFKPIIILFNVVPFLVFLVLYARLLDRHAANDWAWFFSLFAAAYATLLLAFDQTLNNHTVAAWSAFFSLYALVRIVADGRENWAYFATAGFFGAFAACNELPAALFGVLLFLVLLVRSPGRTLFAFVPAALVPCAAFLVTQFIAIGQFTPVYEQFGTKAYTYQGSYWNAPLEFDYYNKEPEPRAVYLFHMTFGHHGFFSLTPIFLLAAWGMLATLFDPERRLRAAAWLTLIVSAAVFAFYAWTPSARNYGGSTQGMRWLFWLAPLWLVMLPRGVEAGQRSRFARGLALALLAVSIFSVGFAMRAPWSHPWIVELMERVEPFRFHLRR
jgi:hypothetical protein